MTHKMVLIFNKKDTEQMSKGEVGVWCAHASHWLGIYLRSTALQLFSWKTDMSNKHAKMSILHSISDSRGWYDWIETDYKKIVLVSEVDLETLYSKAVESKNLQLPSYLQYSSHDKKPKCLAVFIDEKKAKIFTDDMELMK